MIVVKKSHNSGFSLVELVTVIVLLSILGVVALGRFSNQDVFAARGFFDDTVSAVRFAQKLAISTGCAVQVNVVANTSYQLFQRNVDCITGGFTRAVTNPADRGNLYLNANIPDGFTLTGGAITFNARGERVEPTSDFTFSNGSITYAFRVHAGTGLVEAI